MQKALFFGVVGALGCVAGALLGYLLLPPPSGPSTLFSKDLQERLSALGARSGDVQVSLRWYNRNDLDLHCIDPNGERIYFLYRKAQKSRGELDIDRNAKEPYDDMPVENIYWPVGEAPPGRYQVIVYYYNNHGDPDPTNFLCGWIVGNQKKEVTGSISNGDKELLVGEFEVYPQGKRLSLRGAIITGLETAFLGLGLALALVVGQNRYLHRPFLTTRQGLLVVGGALAAGLVAGGAAETIFGLIAHGKVTAILARLLGWLVLGVLLGRGMAYFVPNLHPRRAALAGAIGGLIGAVAFEGGAFTLGDVAGLCLGAAVLGLCVGLMVALVEAFFREAWLEIWYSPRESRNVSLGRDPVTIGSNPACTVYVKEAPALALRYTLQRGKVFCAAGPDGQAAVVVPGFRQDLGSVRVIVRAAFPGKTVSAAAAARD